MDSVSLIYEPSAFLQEELQNQSPLCWKQCMYARLEEMAVKLRSLGLGSKETNGKRATLFKSKADMTKTDNEMCKDR